jgi:AraC family transcriptional regulator
VAGAPLSSLLDAPPLLAEDSAMSAAIDPQIFSIQRPLLDRYTCLAQRVLIVETYSSTAGHMLSEGSLNRISLNRTAHRRYAYRSGGDVFRPISRPAFTLALQPAGVTLVVYGDAAD